VAHLRVGRKAWSLQKPLGVRGRSEKYKSSVLGIYISHFLVNVLVNVNVNVPEPETGCCRRVRRVKATPHREIPGRLFREGREVVGHFGSGLLVIVVSKSDSPCGYAHVHVQAVLRVSRTIPATAPSTEDCCVSRSPEGRLRRELWQSRLTH
jgi:hypothetical protein